MELPFEGKKEGNKRELYEEHLKDPVFYELRENLQILAMRKYADGHPEWSKEDATIEWTDGVLAEAYDVYICEHPEILERFQEDPESTAVEVLQQLKKEIDEKKGGENKILD